MQIPNAESIARSLAARLVGPMADLAPEASGLRDALRAAAVADPAVAVSMVAARLVPLVQLALSLIPRDDAPAAVTAEVLVVEDRRP